MSRIDVDENGLERAQRRTPWGLAGGAGAHQPKERPLDEILGPRPVARQEDQVEEQLEEGHPTIGWAVREPSGGLHSRRATLILLALPPPMRRIVAGAGRLG
jgi:hypothetical protein